MGKTVLQKYYWGVLLHPLWLNLANYQVTLRTPPRAAVPGGLREGGSTVTPREAKRFRTIAFSGVPFPYRLYLAVGDRSF